MSFLAVLLVGVGVGLLGAAAYTMRSRALTESATAALRAATLTLDTLRDREPTAVLVPEPTTGPFAGLVYRALPDPAAQVDGHANGLIVFLDNATRVVSECETAAYAEGRSDQAAEDAAELSPEGYADDPEQADAEPGTLTFVVGPRRPKFTEDEAANVLHAIDSFADVANRTGVSALAVLVSLNVALYSHGLTITHLAGRDIK